MGMAIKFSQKALLFLNEKKSFNDLGITYEEKAFYDILMALRDQYNFEYGTDKKINGVTINEKCKSLAKKVKEIIKESKEKFKGHLIDFILLINIIVIILKSINLLLLLKI